MEGALAQNLRFAGNYCPKFKKNFRGRLGGKNAGLAVRTVPCHYLSDYFGTRFAKIRLSCNSLKILN
ncbi:hypothetical protein A4D02_00780 [Niastella koreensis]|uniref:Uncharacterized protein n=1 Tax=Niastella koreensis TaxID=354356 RepID=A0ABX3P5A5_9BACT|nr:hypothetical protein A4D02_00780 [Niastella koreensis]